MEEAEEALTALRHGEPVRASKRRFFTMNGLELVCHELGMDTSGVKARTMDQRHQKVWDMLTSVEHLAAGGGHGGGADSDGEDAYEEDLMAVDMDVDDEYEDEHGHLKPATRHFAILQAPDPAVLRLIEQFKQRHAPRPE
jgi:hypothetical protein